MSIIGDGSTAYIAGALQFLERKLGNIQLIGEKPFARHGAGRLRYDIPFNSDNIPAFLESILPHEIFAEGPGSLVESPEWSALTQGANKENLVNVSDVMQFITKRMRDHYDKTLSTEELTHVDSIHVQQNGTKHIRGQRHNASGDKIGGESLQSFARSVFISVGAWQRPIEALRPLGNSLFLSDPLLRYERLDIKTMKERRMREFINFLAVNRENLGLHGRARTKIAFIGASGSAFSTYLKYHLWRHNNVGFHDCEIPTNVQWYMFHGPGSEPVPFFVDDAEADKYEYDLIQGRDKYYELENAPPMINRSRGLRGTSRAALLLLQNRDRITGNTRYRHTEKLLEELGVDNFDPASLKRVHLKKIDTPTRDLTPMLPELMQCSAVVQANGYQAIDALPRVVDSQGRTLRVAVDQKGKVILDRYNRPLYYNPDDLSDVRPVDGIYAAGNGTQYLNAESNEQGINITYWMMERTCDDARRLLQSGRCTTAR